MNLAVGQKVIYNNEYIEELERHIQRWTEKYEVEFMPDIKDKCKAKIQQLEKLYEEALDYQGIVKDIIYPDIPNITEVQTQDRKIPVRYILSLN